MVTKPVLNRRHLFMDDKDEKTWSKMGSDWFAKGLYFSFSSGPDFESSINILGGFEISLPNLYVSHKKWKNAYLQNLERGRIGIFIEGVDHEYLHYVLYHFLGGLSPFPELDLIDSGYNPLISRRMDED